MPMTVEQLAEEALALSNEDRVLLADEIVESLGVVGDGRMDELWAQEARRRLDEVRSGRVKMIPGDDALARVRRVLER